MIKRFIFLLMIILVIILSSFSCGQNSQENTPIISEIPGEETQVETTTPAEHKIDNLDITPGKIVFQTSGNIHVINADGTNEIRLTEGSAPRVSPDGKKIAYIVTKTNEKGLYIINIDGTDETKVLDLDENGSISWLWLPDSQHIITASSFKYNTLIGIHIVNVDGSEITKYSDDPSERVAFLPDGGKIAWLSRHQSPKYTQEENDWYYSIGYIRFCDIYLNTYKNKGENEIIVEDVRTEGSMCLNWSPDGTKIIFIEYPGFLNVVNIDGTNRILLAEEVSDALWSPNGNLIAYISNGSIWTINPDGTGRKEMCDCDDYYYGLDWSPDSKKIVFSGIKFVNIETKIITDLVYGTYPKWLK